MIRFVWLLLYAAFVGVGFFYVRTLMTGRGMGAGLEATLSWIPAERNLPRELYGFFLCSGCVPPLRRRLGHAGTMGVCAPLDLDASVAGGADVKG